MNNCVRDESTITHELHGTELGGYMDQVTVKRRVYDNSPPG